MRYLFCDTIFWCFRILPQYHLYSFAWIHFKKIVMCFLHTIILKFQKFLNKHLTFNYMENYIKNYLGQYFINTQTNCYPIGF